jgi:hypothetical protein
MHVVLSKHRRTTPLFFKKILFIAVSAVPLFLFSLLVESGEGGTHTHTHTDMPPKSFFQIMLRNVYICVCLSLWSHFRRCVKSGGVCIPYHRKHFIRSILHQASDRDKYGKIVHHNPKDRKKKGLILHQGVMEYYLDPGKGKIKHPPPPARRGSVGELSITRLAQAQSHNLCTPVYIYRLLASPFILWYVSIDPHP